VTRGWVPAVWLAAVALTALVSWYATARAAGRIEVATQSLIQAHTPHRRKHVGEMKTIEITWSNGDTASTFTTDGNGYTEDAIGLEWKDGDGATHRVPWSAIRDVKISTTP